MSESTQAASTTRTTQGSKPYNPAPVRRHIRREGITPDGIVLANCYSLTQPNIHPKTGKEAPKYDIEVDLHCATARCSCPDFRFRKSRNGGPVSIRHPHLCCKHLVKALVGMERKGEVELVYSDDELSDAIPTGLTFDEGFLLRMREGGKSSGYDQEHDDYLAELMEAETGTWSGEVEDEDPQWFERAVAKWGGPHYV